MNPRRICAAGAMIVQVAACRATAHVPLNAVRGRPTRSQTVDTLLLATASGIVSSSNLVSSIWPGYWPKGQGFILARTRGDVLLVSESAPDSGFQRLDDRILPRVLRGRAFAAHGVIPGLHASSMDGGFNIRYPVAGTRVTAVSVKDSVRTTVEFLFHEAFHAFQDEHFARGPEAVLERSGAAVRTTPVFAAMAEVERRILAEALLADDSSSVSLLRSFLAVRATRLDSAGAVARAEELQMERIEGTAQLVGVQASLAVTRADRREADRLVREILTADLAESDASWRTRLRVYGTGAALGLLLDRLGVPWRGELARGATFVDVLNSAFPLPAGSQELLAESALARYGYREFLNKENAASRATVPQ
jgi:hypothetical protein